MLLLFLEGEADFLGGAIVLEGLVLGWDEALEGGESCWVDTRRFA